MVKKKPVQPKSKAAATKPPKLSKTPVATKAKKTAISPAEAEKQLAGFIAKFEPAMATRIREVRAALRKRLPTAFEVVYDNYNFFVIGCCSTERTSDCIVSIAANSKGVGLSFYYGSTLPDPTGILEGSGRQNRFVRIAGAADVVRPDIDSLIGAAAAQGKVPLSAEGRGSLIIKSISPKQRPRR
jgi:hypothetical protein